VTQKENVGEQLGGFFILEARDMNHAISLVSEHPGLQVGPFEICPVDEVLTALVGAHSKEKLDDSASGSRTPRVGS
jgi:hypothetical protein